MKYHFLFFYIFAITSIIPLFAMHVNTPEHLFYIAIERSNNQIIHITTPDFRGFSVDTSKYTIVPTFYLPLKIDDTQETTAPSSISFSDSQQLNYLYNIMSSSSILSSNETPRFLFETYASKKDIQQIIIENLKDKVREIERLIPNSDFDINSISHSQHRFFVKQISKPIEHTIYLDQKDQPSVCAIYADNIGTIFTSVLTQTDFPAYTFPWSAITDHHTSYVTYTAAALDNLLLQKKHSLIFYLCTHNLSFDNDQTAICHSYDSNFKLNYIAQQALTILHKQDESSYILIIPDHSHVYKMTRTDDFNYTLTDLPISDLDKHKNPSLIIITPKNIPFIESIHNFIVEIRQNQNNHPTPIFVPWENQYIPNQTYMPSIKTAIDMMSSPVDASFFQKILKNIGSIRSYFTPKNTLFSVIGLTVLASYAYFALYKTD